MRKLILLFGLFLAAAPALAEDQDLIDTAARAAQTIFKSATDVADKQAPLSPEDEIALGAKVAEQINSESKLVDGPPLERVKRIAKALLPHISRKEIMEWHVYVMDSPELNAFSTFGGHVWVTTTLLNVMNTDEELAFVVGHEIGHVECRHQAKRISPLLLANKAAGPLAIPVTKLIQAIQQPLSQNDEYEADDVGMALMAQARFKLYGATNAMDKLVAMDTLRGKNNETDNKGEKAVRKIQSYLSSHPASAKRRARLGELRAQLEGKRASK